MKKYELLKVTMLSALMFFVFTISTTAQRSDMFFRADNEELYNDRDDISGGTFGNDPFGEKPVPVGSGLLVLTIAGIGFAVARRKRSLRNGITLLLAFALLIGMTQCKKRIETVTSDSGNMIHFTVNVSKDRHEIIPNEDGYVPVRYLVGDAIYVGNGSKYIGTLTCTVASDADGNNASFEGDILQPNTDDQLHFYFAGGLTPSKTLEVGTTTDFTVDISDQASKLPVLSYTSIAYNDMNTAQITLHNQCALVEFVLNTKTGYPVKVCNMLSEARIDFADPGITPTGVVDAITLYPLASDYSAEYKNKWAIILPGDARNSVARITTGTYGGESYSYYDYDGVPTLNNCDYIYGANAIAINNNATPTNKNLFVVSDNGNVVQFSPGNLQYQASTQTWRFAQNQWDFVGGTVKNSITYGNVYETIGGELLQCNNKYIASDYEGWIDLFGWGTWGDGKSPYISATTSSDYSWSTDFNVTLDGYSDWRTLTAKEWKTLGSHANGSVKIGRGQIHDVRGAIILPDKCSGTYSNGSWTVLSDEDWNTYAAMGAVFLPAAGMRNGTNVLASNQYSTGTNGYYWSKTPSGNNNACYVSVGPGKTDLTITDSGMFRYYGSSVRLVH